MTAALGQFECWGAARPLSALLGDPPPTKPAGRVCAGANCSTRLSIYNVDSDKCAPCQRREGVTVRCAGGDE